MVPVLEFRSYSKYVSEYIERVLHIAADQTLKLNQSQMFETFNLLKSPFPSLPRECQESLARSADTLLQKFIAISVKHSNIFLTLLREISDERKNIIEIKGCISCLVKGDDCFKAWRMNYKRQLLPTTILLRMINKTLDGFAAPLQKSALFQEFLKQAVVLNSEMELSRRRDPRLEHLIAAVQHTQDKSTQKRKNAAGKKKSSCCKWVLGSILLVALIGAAISYDTNVNGKGIFAKSATGKILKDAGLLPYVETAWYATMSTLARAYKWSELHIPPMAKPAISLLCDLLKLIRNSACTLFSRIKDLISTKWPVVANFLEQYVPGLPQKLELFTLSVKNVFVQVCVNFVSFMKENVLVGSLSPENLSKALNQTQNAALEYFNIFNKKVDAYAKLK